MDALSGYSETDEAEHQHYCEACGGIWSHADAFCVGPRWLGRMRPGITWSCPACEDPE